jgi:epoxyqueuosine reductase
MKELPVSFQMEYRAVSCKYLSELQANVDSLRNANKIHNNEVFQSYIADFKYQIPKDFPEAKFVIIAAVSKPIAKIKFQYKNEIHDIYIGSPYYDSGYTDEMVQESLRKRINLPSEFKLVQNRKLHQKLLAVRSGLGKYGRNNLCYVGDMGCFVNLYTFFTDYEGLTGSWEEIETLKYCDNCKICLKNCPTGAIRDDEFVIDISKCLPLYNEIPGIFPSWIPITAHNALMGCLKCQLTCPGNRKALKEICKLEGLNEEETQMILDSNIPKENVEDVCRKLKILDPEDVCRKLKMCDPEDFDRILPRLSRNLKAIILREV